MQNIALENGPVRLVGALDVDRRPTGIVPRRLPNWTRPQVPLFMEIMVTMPSGVRLEFATTSRRIELDVLPTRIEISNRRPRRCSISSSMGESRQASRPTVATG